MFQEGQLRAAHNKRDVVPSVAHVSDSFGNWLSGFVDGEGCFYAGGTATGRVRAVFRLSLRADDADILCEIADTLGFGNTGVTHTRTTDVRSYAVTSFAECVALSNLFERYPLRSKKRHDFAAWSRIVRRAYETYALPVSEVRADLLIMQRVKHPTRVAETA